jgi:hypothetical protein
MEKGYFDGNFDRIPKSWFRNSILRNPKRKQLERLQKLAGIAVEFPWMLSLINFAIKLPLSPLYSQLMKIHKAYCYRYRLMPLRLTFAQILRLCWKYLFDRSS